MLLSAPYEKLSDTLTNMQERDLYNSTDSAWKQFLYDHKELIRKKSKRSGYLVEKDLIKYRYSIRRYILEVFDNTGSIELAFRIVNNLPDNVEFEPNLLGTKVYIPSPSYIQELRNEFKTLQAMNNKIDKK